MRGRRPGQRHHHRTTELSVTDRLDAYQREHRWLGFPLAVVYKYADDQGPYLAALLTYYGLLSLFPMLLLATTVLGYVLAGDPALQNRLIESALSQFPVIGTQIEENVRSLRGSGLGLTIGIIGTVYGTLGIANAGQSALNRIWGVPRFRRRNPLFARLRSAVLLLVFGVGILAVAGLTAASTSSSTFGPWLRVAVISGAVLVNTLVFVATFRLAPAISLSTRDVLAGAVSAAVAWQLLQVGGAYFVNHYLRGATEVYGLFALVLGLIAWIYLVSATVLLCAEANAVRAQRLWPRSLLTPFTDNVELTAADERAYASYARSESHKGFEKVDVTFDTPPDGP